MTNEELKDLKARLWKTADQLRSGSGLKPTKYSPPILGVIFLRFANSKYANAEERIATEYHRRLGTRAELSIDKIAIGICGFYLPECAKYDVILIDAFKGENAPFELTTYEAMKNARNILNDNGMVITRYTNTFLENSFSPRGKVVEHFSLRKVLFAIWWKCWPLQRERFLIRPAARQDLLF